MIVDYLSLVSKSWKCCCLLTFVLFVHSCRLAVHICKKTFFSSSSSCITEKLIKQIKYSYGAIGLIWVILIIAMISDHPGDHKFISNKERHYIVEEIRKHHTAKPSKKHVPFSLIHSFISFFPQFYELTIILSIKAHSMGQNNELKDLLGDVCHAFCSCMAKLPFYDSIAQLHERCSYAWHEIRNLFLF